MKVSRTQITVVAAVVATLFASQSALAQPWPGSVVAWGLNGQGQCDAPLPNEDFIAIAAGWYHSLGLKTDGSVVAWGCDDPLYDYGQCDVPDPNADFIGIAAGWKHSLGLKADGSVVAWGRNDYGECDVPEPNADFIAVAGGLWHSLGIQTTQDTDTDGVLDPFDACPNTPAPFGISPDGRPKGDLDDDCDVDLNDFATFAGNYTG
jgi:alpha-tubulin suppressor-like RCC1 family protein